MVTSFVIIILSLAMFVYWFRYSCILILESNWGEEQAQVVATQIGLSFGSIEGSLARADTAQSIAHLRIWMLGMDLWDRRAIQSHYRCWSLNFMIAPCPPHSS